MSSTYLEFIHDEPTPFLVTIRYDLLERHSGAVFETIENQEMAKETRIRTLAQNSSVYFNDTSQTGLTQRM